MAVTTSKRRYTLEDYLGVEEMSSVRHEYLDGAIFAMAGGTPQHAALCIACAQICDGCAQSCEAIAGDETMGRCAKTCRDCAQSCRDMSKQAL